MYARVMIGQTKPEKKAELDNAIQTYQASIVPTAEKQSGYQGSLLLTNPYTGKVISITLWETEDQMQANEQNDYLQTQIEKVNTIMAGPGTLDHYQVSVQTFATHEVE